MYSAMTLSTCDVTDASMIWSYDNTEKYYLNSATGQHLDMFFSESGVHVCYCTGAKSNCQWNAPSLLEPFYLKSAYKSQKCLYEDSGGSLQVNDDCGVANMWSFMSVSPTSSPTISPTMPTSMPTSAPTAFISFLFPNEASDWIVNSTYFIELRVGSSASTRVRLELFASLDLIDPVLQISEETTDTIYEWKIPANNLELNEVLDETQNFFVKATELDSGYVSDSSIFEIRYSTDQKSSISEGFATSAGFIVIVVLGVVVGLGIICFLCKPSGVSVRNE